MARPVRFAAVLLLATSSTVLASPPATVPTRCEERELSLDRHHTVALLEGCGGSDAGDLLWHLDRIDQLDGELDGRFDRGSAGRGSLVYVMDTGIRADHREFEGKEGSRVVAGIDVTAALTAGASSCSSPSRSLAPCYSTFEELFSSSHGTAVASIIGGTHVGVAPEVSLVSVRIMNERGLTTTATYMQALEEIIRHAFLPEAPAVRTAVINISGWVLERLSAAAFTSPVVRFAAVERKIREMVEGVDAAGKPDPDGKRFLFVVAANNVDGGCGPDGVVDRFPAILGPWIDGVITVGGMTAANTWWDGSCRGAVEVLAPAQGIFSATITGPDHYGGRQPNHRSGTSFAAPIISGIAARLLAERPDLTPAQLETWIRSTPSRIIDPKPAFADGRVAYVPSLAPTPVASHLPR
ncbi:MAG TPA: S8 family serine peptidase [Thermoanaerobaculia bacterium]|nr:S8 family serine peptidase [Thermoanaerobaculia bacterium]